MPFAFALSLPLTCYSYYRSLLFQDFLQPTSCTKGIYNPQTSVLAICKYSSFLQIRQASGYQTPNLTLQTYCDDSVFDLVYFRHSFPQYLVCYCPQQNPCQDPHLDQIGALWHYTSVLLASLIRAMLHKLGLCVPS